MLPLNRIRFPHQPPNSANEDPALFDLEKNR